MTALPSLGERHFLECEIRIRFVKVGPQPKPSRLQRGGRYIARGFENRLQQLPLLQAQGRHPYRPAHLHALIFKQGYKTLISQVFDPSDPNIESDVQFGVTAALTGDFVRHDEPHPSNTDVIGPWFSLDYTYVMEPGEAILPRPPIK